MIVHDKILHKRTYRKHPETASSCMFAQKDDSDPQAYPKLQSEVWHRIGQPAQSRSEEHTSELQSLMRISYAVFCLKKKKKTKHIQISHNIRKLILCSLYTTIIIIHTSRNLVHSQYTND